MHPPTWRSLGTVLARIAVCAFFGFALLGWARVLWVWYGLHPGRPGLLGAAGACLFLGVALVFMAVPETAWVRARRALDRLPSRRREPEE